MDKEVLEEWLAEGLTIAAMAARAGVDKSTVRRWLRKHALETSHMARRRALAAARREGRESVMASCSRHGLTEFRLRPDGEGYRCLRCRSDDVSNARRRRKDALVALAGGRCQACGYDRYAGALQFHHRDPRAKSFALSHRGIPRAFERMRAEFEKCVLLCANCHAEVEAGLRVLTGRPNMDGTAADNTAASIGPG